VLASGIEDLRPGWWHFDPIRAELRLLDPASKRLVAVSREFEQRGFDLRGGFAAVFAVASFERTLRRYPAGSTLVWRDAGVVLGGLHLCSADLGLASCIVATCGLLMDDVNNATMDVGAVVLGTYGDDDPA
jgi:hypothetical protein